MAGQKNETDEALAVIEQTLQHARTLVTDHHETVAAEYGTDDPVRLQEALAIVDDGIAKLARVRTEMGRLRSKLGRTADGAYVGIGDSVYTARDFHGRPMNDAVEGVAWGDDDPGGGDDEPGERKWYRAEFWLPADRSDITTEVHRPLSEAWSTRGAALAAALNERGRLIEEIPGFPPEARNALARLDPPVTTVGELINWQRQHGDDWPERIPDVGSKAHRDAQQALDQHFNR